MTLGGKKKQQQKDHFLAQSNMVWFQACDTVNADSQDGAREAVSDSAQAAAALQMSPLPAFPTLPSLKRRGNAFSLKCYF
jgi:hypothetical protein